MNLDVTVNGRPWKVAVQPAEQPGKFTVTIKGKSRVVDASWIDAETLSLIDGSKAREIRLHPRAENGGVGVEIAGRLFEAVVTKRQTGASGLSAVAMREGGAKADAVFIKAPMPGRVIRVLVNVGDGVTAKQPLVVVEAMKMENELRSPRDGVVKEVLVTPVTAVESGAVLVVIE